MVEPLDILTDIGINQRGYEDMVFTCKRWSKGERYAADTKEKADGLRATLQPTQSNGNLSHQGDVSTITQTDANDDHQDELPPRSYWQQQDEHSARDEHHLW